MVKSKVEKETEEKTKKTTKKAKTTTNKKSTSNAKSTPKKQATIEEKGKNLMAKLSLTALIVFALVFLFWPSQKYVNIGLLICAFSSILAAIFGIIAKIQIKKSNEKGSGLALAGIIIGIIGFIISAYTLFIFDAVKDVEFNDPILCPEVVNCVDKGNGTSICEFAESIQIPCSTDKLTEEQFK